MRNTNPKEAPGSDSRLSKRTFSVTLTSTKDTIEDVSFSDPRLFILYLIFLLTKTISSSDSSSTSSIFTCTGLSGRSTTASLGVSCSFCVPRNFLTSSSKALSKPTAPWDLFKRALSSLGTLLPVSCCFGWLLRCRFWKAGLSQREAHSYGTCLWG